MQAPLIGDCELCIMVHCSTAAVKWAMPDCDGSIAEDGTLQHCEVYGKTHITPPVKDERGGHWTHLFSILDLGQHPQQEAF